MDTPYKNFWRRVGALTVDISLLLVISLMLSSGAYCFLSISPSSLLLIQPWLLIPCALLYGTILTKKYQATLGKKLFGLYVSRVDGKSLSWGQSLARSLVKLGHTLVELALGYLLIILIFRLYTVLNKFEVFQNLMAPGPDKKNITRELSFLFLVIGSFFISMVGYWICLFNAKQRALQDWVCGTTVRKKTTNITNIYANFWRRVGALVIDGTLLYLTITVISLVFPLFKDPTEDLFFGAFSNKAYLTSYFFIICALLGVLYDTVLVKYFQGTLGKIWLSLKIVSANGKPLSWTQCAARSAVHYGHLLFS